MNALCEMQYYSSGFFWENYDSTTGKGAGVHPFTGWTTLFVLIMTEKYEYPVWKKHTSDVKTRSYEYLYWY